MRIRKTNALLAAGLLLSAFLFMYLMIDTSSSGLYDNPEAQKVELNYLENKLKNLENDLLVNQNIINDIKGTVKEIIDTQKKQEPRARGSSVVKNQASVNKTRAIIDKGDVGFAQQAPSKCDIDMSQVYSSLTFDNPDGGVWKQGWDIKYDDRSWSAEKKLKVIVMPHSHNDPGWIKTYEKYYQDQTKSILDTMAEKLGEDPRRKFIWAEISFLSMWWREQGTETKQKVLKYLETGQLEIVTGGWVMNDEANSHYYAITEQLLGGHEWCELNLNGYKPTNGWAIDPFGMSPTMAYLLKRMGFDNMLIQRTHYSVKKHLAKDKNLEFKWRQHWDHGESSDMFCHMMPFYSYDVPHTCGPDPKVCCQFDFLRLPGGRASCPWRVPPKKIREDNVAERARTLLDQYKKKSQLYKTDVVLIPLGDDFRWDSPKEWDDQFLNYQKIMDYVEKHPELNADISWGTLGDYFEAVRKQSETETGDEVGMFPSLSGDFFTYADRDDHYWSGYYTSRPFWKNLDRVLEGYLRAGEIMFSMAWAEMEYVGSDKKEMALQCMQNLVVARQNLALFQHHDGITGTAKDHVALDYGDKLLKSIQAVQSVMSQSANFLLTSSKAFFKPALETTYFDLDDSRTVAWSIPQQKVIQIEESGTPSRVVVYNSHGRRRQELVTFKVSLTNIKVFFMAVVDGDEEEEVLPSQISPVFNSDGEIQNTEFQVTFLATVPALGLATFFVQALRPEEGDNPDNSVASVKIFNSEKTHYQVAPFNEVEVFKKGDNFKLTNAYVAAEFNNDGLLEAITTLDDGIRTKAKIEFITYGTKRSGDKSGAYLFLPDGPGKVKPLNNPLVRIVEGKISSYVEVHQPWNKHTVTIVNSPGVDGTALQIENDIALTNEAYNNVEISMRVSTDIDSEDTFFTDLNGFQMIKRKRYKKLPIQANWYPLPSMGYIQDKSSRLSVITGQPLGGTSAESGQFEVMLDRRLMQDDNRGLFQGVMDNKVTPHHFTLLLERVVKGCKTEPDTQASYPSLLGHAVRHSLLNPMYRMIYLPEHFNGNSLKKTYKPVDKDLPCDIHIVNLRTMLQSQGQPRPSENSALIVHRQGFTSCYKPVGLTCSTNGGKISVELLFPELYSDSIKQMSLSLMYDGMKMEKAFTVSIQPMEMYSFVLTR